MKKFDVAKLAGIASVIIAGVVAVVGEISSQKEHARIEDMDKRIKNLETKKEEEDL